MTPAVRLVWVQKYGQWRLAGLPERRACRVLGQSRTSQRYQAITLPDEGPLTACPYRKLDPDV